MWTIIHRMYWMIVPRCKTDRTVRVQDKRQNGTQKQPRDKIGEVSKN